MENFQNTKDNIYDEKWLNHWGVSRQSYGPSFYHRKRLIKRLITGNIKKRRILEVGCGDGSILIEVQEFPHQSYGIDISEIAVNLAISKFGHLASFSVGDITDFKSIPEGDFDLIICSEVLEHIENDELALKNMYKKLKKGGHLIVTVPHKKKYWSKNDDNDAHLRRYEKEELEDKIIKNGFTICKSLIWGYPFFQTYYKFFVRNINDKITPKVNKKSKIKKFLSSILILIFYFDDLFMNNLKGRNLFVVAKK